MFSYAQELKRTILSTIMSSGVVAREHDIIESNCYKKKKGFHIINLFPIVVQPSHVEGQEN